MTDPQREPLLERLVRLSRTGATGQAGVGWRLVVPAVFAAAGFLFVTSAEASDGLDLRPQREATLAELVRTESSRVDALQRRAGELEDRIDALTARVNTNAVGRLQAQADRLRAAAGMLPARGAALKVTLDDAPDDQPVPEGLDANAMVVHQQDLQAVVNALWAGGAEGITLQGQRLISTTGIKCVGNTVVLHGVPYSPPYEIVAVGDPVQMQQALDASEYVQTYLEYTQPPVNIGWDVELLTEVTLPGYQSAVNLQHADAPARAVQQAVAE
ncbi:MAG: DUF881 domain-containing protein [Actinomycetota bacterium]|nr:DUF881 domain-containing protein [Actinomycetota bacterium]